jgi:methionine-rich copper-binding protein CopC
MKLLHLLLTLSLSLGFISFAHAHAFLDEADPRVGSTVSVSPTQVKIWFTEKLAGSSSEIQVFAAKGAEIDHRDSKIDDANPLLMTVSLEKLPPGRYRVKWSAVAIDTHHTTGTFTFDVRS